MKKITWEEIENIDELSAKLKEPCEKSPSTDYDADYRADRFFASSKFLLLPLEWC